MKFWEAMKALEEGKGIRCKAWIGCLDRWEKGVFDYHANEGEWRNCIWTDAASRIYLMMQEEWELFEEPVQLLSFAEVVKGLKEGKKFRRNAWQDETALIQKGNCKYFMKETYLLNQKGDMCNLWIGDFAATDWVEVK